jgi:hypothetical protein
MAYDFLDQSQNIDVISNAQNIKNLLMLALSDGGISMLVHPIGKTLLIDNFDIHKFLLKPTQNWKWLRRFFFEYVVTNMADKNKAVMRKSHRNDALTERNLMSKFLHYR